MGNKALTRRDFVKYMMAGSTLSVAALDKLNASMYQSIKELNQKYIREEAPDGVYWDAIRNKFMFQDGMIMMNNGTVGPMPKPVFNTLMKTFKVQVTHPVDVYAYLPRQLEGVRTKLAEFIQADICQTNGIEHSRIGLNDPWDRISLSWFDTDTLGDKTAERIHIHKLCQFVGIAACPGSCKNRVCQLQAGKVN